VTVAVVFTGGTIASRVDAAAGGAVPALRGADILARTPGLAETADIEVIDWGLVTASHMGFDQMLAIARLLESTLARPEIDGAVVVQGTDTIEETSFAYDLLVATDKPIVVTGAMRNSSEPGYDGPANLRAAVACAASAELRGQGVVVVLNGLIVGADQAVKTHATALDTFQPHDGSPLGTVAEGAVRLAAARAPLRLPAIPEQAAEPVLLVTFVSGMDGTVIRLLGGQRPVGFVLAAAGSGNTQPDFQAAALEQQAAGAVVVLTSRCAFGSVAPIYAFPGGGATWARAGVLMSALHPLKARVALALGLGAGLGRDTLKSLLRA
jgi:L-asparaginase